MSAIRKQKLNWASEVRANATKLWEALQELEALQSQHAALDYGNTLTTQDLAESDHEGLTVADLGAACFATPDAIRALMNQGHATNIAKVLN